jgi:hypothetical protein
MENVQILADTNTLSGPAYVYLVLTAGSDAASLSLTIDGNSIVLKAPAGETVSLPECLKVGSGKSAAVALTGTGPTAYAIHEVK